MSIFFSIDNFSKSEDQIIDYFKYEEDKTSSIQCLDKLKELVEKNLFEEEDCPTLTTKSLSNFHHIVAGTKTVNLLPNSVSSLLLQSEDMEDFDEIDDLDILKSEDDKEIWGARDDIEDDEYVYSSCLCVDNRTMDEIWDNLSGDALRMDYIEDAESVNIEVFDTEDDGLAGMSRFRDEMWDTPFGDWNDTSNSSLTKLKIPDLVQTDTVKLEKLTPLSALKKEYFSIEKESASFGFIIPERRICNFCYKDSNFKIERAKTEVFITDDEIISIEPIKFLPNSPFFIPDNPENMAFLDKIVNESVWKEVIDSKRKAVNAIAITRNGKHVILQQAVQSCVPTCIAMLALDHGKTPDYELIKTTALANDKEEATWLKELGFEVHPSKLMGATLINWQKTLFKCLAERGPGILSITHPQIGNHAIILDEISKDLQTATIRDPFHGRMVTIQVELLQHWIISSPAQVPSIEFMQVTIPDSIE